ncbi:MAG: hypothetical protein A2521_11885 [Deltaproteobacteria bacterium RIFOXYD12_FULL_57_12]|nr:MAG: hypothetical protein A2521_11885 [Deltaproteobacteria bacterium RIFOXYD12_FULL_57_12]
MVFLFIIIGSSVGIAAAVASELTYTPVNPSFGGSPLNAGPLMNAAIAQKDIEVPEDRSTSRNLMDDFESSLTRRVLNSLANQVIDTAFGGGDSGDLADGHYEFGDYIIDILNTEGDNIQVTITDLVGGGTTTIEVPYY